jgi:carboxymethylenebutenolidase
MWNQFPTDQNDAMTCEVINIKGHNGDEINAYYARPAGNGPYPGIVLVHHLPGWDEFYRETARRFAQHGYATISPNFYARFGFGTPDDAAARARGEGGVSDESVTGDCQAAADFLRAQSNSNGKLGIIGTCSGGRHSYVAACSTGSFNAVVDCWGGRLVMAQEDLNPRQPVSPLDMTKDLNAPLLGIFGNDDQNPSPEQVDKHEEELKKQGKQYEFHRYDGAGHGFWYYHAPAYRQQQAMDSWNKVFDFFAKNLA